MTAQAALGNLFPVPGTTACGYWRGVINNLAATSLRMVWYYYYIGLLLLLGKSLRRLFSLLLFSLESRSVKWSGGAVRDFYLHTAQTALSASLCTDSVQIPDYAGCGVECVRTYVVGRVPIVAPTLRRYTLCDPDRLTDPTQKVEFWD